MWWIQLSGRYLGKEGYNWVNIYVVDTVVREISRSRGIKLGQYISGGYSCQGDI